MLHIGNGHNMGLGDLTILTAIAKQTECVVELPPGGEKYAVLFNDLAYVKITEKPTFTAVDESSTDLWVCDKMRTLNKEADAGLDVDDYMPIIFPSKAALEWARATLNKDMLPMKPNCSAQHKLTRECHPQKWDRLVKALVSSDAFKDVEIVQFGITDNFDKLFGATVKLDWSIERLAAAYSVIGRYVGIDTGDLHVALAVGCKCLVFHPGECPGYRHNRWKYEHENIRYVNFNEMETIDERYVSDFFGRVLG